MSEQQTLVYFALYARPESWRNIAAQVPAVYVGMDRGRWEINNKKCVRNYANVSGMETVHLGRRHI
jgi:hypothetical protein